MFFYTFFISKRFLHIVYTFKNEYYFVTGYNADGVKISSENKHVKRYSNIHLNCSSNMIPIGKTSHLEVSGKSFTKITLLPNGECLSSVLGKTCTPAVCACSKRGLWYSHIYDVFQHVGVINITCSMILEVQGSSSDSIIVKIIGKQKNISNLCSDNIYVRYEAGCKYIFRNQKVELQNKLDF